MGSIVSSPPRNTNFCLLLLQLSHKIHYINRKSMHLPELCQNLFPSQPVLYYFTNNLTYTRVAIYRLFVTNNLYCECHARWIKLDKLITLRFEVGGQIAVVTGHLIIWVTTSWAARDTEAYQYGGRELPILFFRIFY